MRTRRPDTYTSSAIESFGASRGSISKTVIKKHLSKPFRQPADFSQRLLGGGTDFPLPTFASLSTSPSRATHTPLDSPIDLEAKSIETQLIPRLALQPASKACFPCPLASGWLPNQLA